ncbi:MAG: hypothetical protein JST38_05295 [Bacteroidetes bacterium]|nr:hypothetical protein [Bacteroidota bacterium]MBS1940273.1 hypothetical protein [Bacteroidota bacterium]
MKALAFTALLLMPLVSSAQQDGSRADSTKVSEKQHALVISAGSDGMRVGVDRPDTMKSGPDTIRITTKRKLIRIITTTRPGIDTSETFADRIKDLRQERRNLFTYWAGLELGVNTFIAPDGRVGDGPQSGPLQLNNAKSRFFAINFMEEKIEFGSHHAGLFTGLGVEFLNYKLSENNTLAFNGDSTWAVAMEKPELRKNKLRQIGLRVPLMLEFNTKRAQLPADEAALKRMGNGGQYSRKNNFHLAMGVVGSWYFDTMYKQKYSEGGHNVKNRSKDDYNLLPYRLAARAQIGFGGLNLFAEYALTPMFEEGTAPDLRALNVGLTLVGFN